MTFYHRRINAALLALMVFFGVAAQVARADENLAVVTGAVRDAGGAGVTGARVIISGPAT